MIYVSATPGSEEIEKSDEVVEQVIRPTGLIDPEIVIKKTEGQIEDLYSELLKFNFRSGLLRKKFDSIKYHLAALEDLVLKIKLK